MQLYLMRIVIGLASIFNEVLTTLPEEVEKLYPLLASYGSVGEVNGFNFGPHLINYTCTYVFWLVIHVSYP